MSLDISSITDKSCWYFVWLAGSRAPLLVTNGSCELDVLGVPTVPVLLAEVGVPAAGGRCGVPEAAGRGVPVGVGVEGVLERENESLPPPETLVRLVPAAANNCC